MKTTGPAQTSLASFAELDLHGLETLQSMARLFDRVPDIVFIAKDREGRYLAASQSLIRR